MVSMVPLPPKSRKTTDSLSHNPFLTSRIYCLLWSLGAETVVIGFQKSRIVLTSTSYKRPLVARSVMSAISGLVCEGKWSQRAGRGSGRPSCM